MEQRQHTTVTIARGGQGRHDRRERKDEKQRGRSDEAAPA